jgi:hypothetical protein
MIGNHSHRNKLCLITGYNLAALIVAAVIVPGMNRIVTDPEITSQYTGEE